MRPDPRTGLAAGVALAVASLTGPGAAAATLVLSAGLAVLARLPPALLLPRLLPLALGFAGLAIVAPLAPGAVGDAALRGLAASVAVVVTSGVVPWPAAAGLAGRLGAPPAAVAFLAILARHLGAVREELVRLHRALVLRGGFDRLGRLPASTQLLLVRALPSALGRAERVADALALRGFRGRLPALPPWRPGAADLPWLGAGLLALVAAALQATGGRS